MKLSVIYCADRAAEDENRHEDDPGKRLPSEECLGNHRLSKIFHYEVIGGAVTEPFAKTEEERRALMDEGYVGVVKTHENFALVMKRDRRVRINATTLCYDF